MERAELEEKLKANEEEQAALAAERNRFAEFKVLGFLATGWVRAIEGGTVDWDDLITRLETALATAQRKRGS